MLIQQISASERKTFLEGLGIIPPPTEQSLKNIVDYIEQGNGLKFPKGREGRIALVKKAQEEWHGKRVSTKSKDPRYPPEQGTVRYLVFRTRSGVAGILESHNMSARNPKARMFPYRGYVAWDKGRPTVSPLGYLVTTV